MQKRLMSVIATSLLVVSGCGGNVDQSCDDVRVYQLAREGKRIEVPADLDPLDELREIPLPDASPQASRETGSPCLDLPPNVLATE